MVSYQRPSQWAQAQTTRIICQLADVVDSRFIINLKRIPPGGLQWIPCPSWAGRDWFHLSAGAQRSLCQASSSPEMDTLLFLQN